MSEVVPPVAGQYLRRGRVAKDAGGVLREDAVACESPEHAMQRVGVGMCPLRQIRDISRAFGEHVCDPQIRDRR
jgi:hypothetical protein